jgi:hypothetical protein
VSVQRIFLAVVQLPGDIFWISSGYLGDMMGIRDVIGM